VSARHQVSRPDREGAAIRARLAIRQKSGSATEHSSYGVEIASPQSPAALPRRTSTLTGSPTPSFFLAVAAAGHAFPHHHPLAIAAVASPQDSRAGAWRDLAWPHTGGEERGGRGEAAGPLGARSGMASAA